MKIVLTGGGTGGSVTPLLAIAESLKRREQGSVFLFLGTRGGPEHVLVPRAGIEVVSIPCGKLRRYLSVANLLDFFRIIRGFFRSLWVLRGFRPDAVIGTGSYVQVPVMWAAFVLGIPVLVHQQDILPGLANTLVAPVASKVTVAFSVSASAFPKAKTVVTGNPVREAIFRGSRKRAQQELGLNVKKPVLLSIGGGTGAQRMNALTVASAPALLEHVQIIHLTGPGKSSTVTAPEYHRFAFLTDALPDVFAAADVVLSRAGMSTLTECLALGKAMIVMPMPDSHQEQNALFFEAKGAALLVKEQDATPEHMIMTILSLLRDQKRRAALAAHARAISTPDAADTVAAIAATMIKKH